MTLTAVTVPDVGGEQINTSPSTWYLAIDVVNAFFFSIPVHKDHQKQSDFSMQGQ